MQANVSYNFEQNLSVAPLKLSHYVILGAIGCLLFVYYISNVQCGNLHKDECDKDQ